MAARSLYVALVAVVSVAPAPVRAGNADSWFLSNEAMLTGGAVTAVTRGPGAVWYNPAGLGGASRSILDVSGSAFVLRLRDMPGAVQTTLLDGDHTGDVSSSEYLSVPAALVFVRQLTPTVTAGLGVFVPALDRLEFDHVLRAPGWGDAGGGEVYDLTQRLLVKGSAEEMHGVLSVGWQALDWLRVGLGLHVIYADWSLFAQALVDVTTRDGDGTVWPLQTQLIEFSEQIGGVGLQLTFGTQIDMGSGWHLGVVARSPGFLVYRFGRTEQLETFASASSEDAAGEIDAVFQEEEISEWGFRMQIPARLGLALGYRFEGGFVGLEGDVRLPLEDEEYGIDHRLAWNARLGGRMQLTPGWAIGAGLFTDTSADPPPDGLGSTRVDFYGVACGVEFRTPHTVVGREDREPLVLATTVGFRYALGLGEFGGLRLDLTGEGEAEDAASSFTRDATFHEIAVHIGSALYF